MCVRSSYIYHRQIESIYTNVDWNCGYNLKFFSFYVWFIINTQLIIAAENNILHVLSYIFSIYSEYLRPNRSFLEALFAVFSIAKQVPLTVNTTTYSACVNSPYMQVSLCCYYRCVVAHCLWCTSISR